MKEELNIAAILKDKPAKTKLWSPIFGECEVRYINDDIDNSISVVATYSLSSYGFIKDGRLSEKGECMLFPSRNMLDWSKFAWKKGDVLRFSDILVIFEKWTKDDYTKFKGVYEFNIHSKSFKKGNDYDTSEFCKAINQVADNFIKEIEKKYGGKLNLETLQIEKQPEFNDGDIVCFYNGNGCYDTIAIIKEQGKEIFEVYTFLEIPIMKLYLNKDKFYPYTRASRLATDSDKQRLFEALAEEGKAWDADKKMLVDLPKKYVFKALDLCLMRDIGEMWKLCQFGFFDKKNDFDRAPYNAVGGNWYNECIPYNDQTKHLLGTTDEWKGGKL